MIFLVTPSLALGLDKEDASSFDYDINKNDEDEMLWTLVNHHLHFAPSPRGRRNHHRHALLSSWQPPPPSHRPSLRYTSKPFTPVMAKESNVKAGNWKNGPVNVYIKFYLLLVMQMVFSAYAFAQSEDPNDPTIGFLLDGMVRLCCLVRKYIAAIRGYALSYLSSGAGRIRFLLGTPGMVALDLDATLKGLFQRIVQHLENIPKPQGEKHFYNLMFASSYDCFLTSGVTQRLVNRLFSDIQELRKDWLTVLMIVTSARSSINIRHLEKATVSTGKEGLLSEGNAAYNWSRVHNKEEAKKAKLSNKPKLLELYLGWETGREGETTNDENVLEGLQPHSRLKKLEIFGFGGRSFPSWARNMEVDNGLPFNKLVKIRLSDCSECEEIPLLEELMLDDMLDDLPKLTVLKGIESGDASAVSVFPRLQHLTIEDCRVWSRHPQFFEKLSIKDCPNLKRIGDLGVQQSQESLRSLTTLEIITCKALLYLPCEMLGSSLKRLWLEDLSSLENLPEIIARLLKSPRLTYLTITGVPQCMTTCFVEIPPPFSSLAWLTIDASVGGLMETVNGILQGCSSLNVMSYN
ncbi:hypothetical protein SASPL_146382 [Salvia splendens]|uniref:R13L1/DRL21-like LRR repeat region domain-containing protein n=1 Tax=Salvia splendens TaxID=180675 RepID=A0A8X8Z548_SALSN|nr:hypothetical protein SASPL_146382 [Salvia splendens]